MCLRLPTRPAVAARGRAARFSAGAGVQAAQRTAAPCSTLCPHRREPPAHCGTPECLPVTHPPTLMPNPHTQPEQGAW
eukprot:scaffold107568_cov77-Phaeocystis_antarctica.AAC.4